MAEYIEREATCQDCFHYDVCDYHITEMTTMTVNECPHKFVNKADVVEVVRCKDCKHKGWVQEPCHGKSIDYCRLHEFAVHGYDFCIYGERKDAEEGG